GVGLGLAIVRHVATNHGGEVRVESTEGEGSSFTLAVPVSDDEQVEQGDSQSLQSIGAQA
ncbi:MAG: ATP-binding protein, partial [bacterium]|nr:ATP-binding protein [bacterium]